MLLQCAVGDIGQCLSTSKRVEGATYYLADSATYCESSDTVCTTCRTRWLEEYAASGEVKASAVCSGEDGCICLAVCEREARDALVIQDECPANEKAKVGSVMLVMAMGLASFIVFSMIVFCLKKLLRCTMPCTCFSRPNWLRRSLICLYFEQGWSCIHRICRRWGEDVRREHLVVRS